MGSPRVVVVRPEGGDVARDEHTALRVCDREGDERV